MAGRRMKTLAQQKMMPRLVKMPTCLMPLNCVTIMAPKVHAVVAAPTMTPFPVLPMMDAMLSSMLTPRFRSSM